MFIPEETIDKVLEDLDEGQISAEASMEAFTGQQPVLMSYLLSEGFDLLTEKERDFMLHLALVIWLAVGRTYSALEPVDPETLEDFEEKNWEVMNLHEAKKFRDRLNPFFEETDQEDLLAFIEDALVLEEESEEEISKESREPLFVGLKTIVDCLTAKS